jgi:predicted transposase YbfD/YdcC
MSSSVLSSSSADVLFGGSLVDHFGSLSDPRVSRTRKHKLVDILFIALCAMICGADTFKDIALWGRCKRDWLTERLQLENGIPSHDTFGRVFARLDPNAFSTCFVAWTQSLYEKTEGEVIALDGKRVCNSFDTATGKSTVHLVSAWAASSRLSLIQKATENKSNEITAFPALLKLLDISGCLVTIDAAGCQKEIAQQIMEQEGDYVLALKGNQSSLHERVKDNFAHWQQEKWQIPFAYRYHQTLSKGHGRIETRRCWVVDGADFVDIDNQWKGLRSIVLVESERRAGQGDKQKVTVEQRCFLTSLSTEDPKAAQKVLRAVRQHWGIENRLHWVLDVVFCEDKCRVRKDHSATNLALARKITLNLCQRESLREGAEKISLRLKRKRAGWDNDYLETIITGKPYHLDKLMA